MMTDEGPGELNRHALTWLPRYPTCWHHTMSGNMMIGGNMSVHARYPVPRLLSKAGAARGKRLPYSLVARSTHTLL